MSRLLIAAGITIGAAQAVLAQTVRGAVVDAGGRPVSVVVILVDPAAQEVGRALTNERGEYRLVAPRPGSYRLRTLRIGFQSVLTEPFALVAGDDLTRQLVVSGIAFALDTVRAVGRNPCRVVAGDSTTVVSAIWDQVRSALIATQLTVSNRTVYNTTLAYERMQDVRSQRIGSQTVDIRADFARQPWRSLPADSLRKIGYVYTAPDSSRIYNSPDLAVLLSEEFLVDHCLRIASESNAQRLGIDFVPTPQRRGVSEITGTLWLDRKTNELIEMEHRYVNRLDPQEERIAGGSMGFTRMRNGMWAISRWNIRMPSMVMAPVYSPTFAILRYAPKLDSVKVTGGELVLATTTGMRRDTIWMRPTLSLRGAVLDSMTGAPVRRAIVALAGTIQVDTTGADGRFDLHGVLPGRYSLNITTPSLDSVNTVDTRNFLFADSSMVLNVRVPNATLIAGSVCGNGNTATRLGAGIVLGSVARAGDSLPMANAKVKAEWTDIVIGGSQGVANQTRSSETRTDARGVFRICGLPTKTTFTFYAVSDSGEASPVRIALGAEQLFARADLVVDRRIQVNASFIGTVVDSAGAPLADTEVKVMDVGLGVRTGPDGSFGIADVLPGNHLVVVRRVGYGPLEIRLDFEAGRTTSHKIQLTRITLLDSLLSTARRDRDPNMDRFEERKRLGLGQFVTLEEIRTREGSLLTSFLYQRPGLNVLSMQGQDFVEGKRPMQSSCTSGRPVPRTGLVPESGMGRCLMREGVYYVPDESERKMGVPVACFARVYLDNQLINPGTPTRPFNLREIPTTQVEAMEFYAGSTQVPTEYFARNSSCGVLVIHTRRPK